MASHTLTLYLGSNIEGEKLLKKIEAHCQKQKISVSEYVKALIVKDLKGD